MYNCQQALLHHIRTEFTAPNVNTVKGYAGELKKGHLETVLVPAILVLYIDSTPTHGSKRFHHFDLVVIEENRALDHQAGLEQNLQLTQSIVEYLYEHSFFLAQAAKGSYWIDQDRIQARVIPIDTPRYTIIALSLYIDDRTLRKDKAQQ